MASYSRKTELCIKINTQTKSYRTNYGHYLVAWPRISKSTMHIVGLSVVQVLAWIVRFCNNCKSKQKKRCELDIEDLNHAEDLIIAHAQQVSFPVEYKLLKSQQPLPKSSKLLNLSPFIEDDIVKAETK